MSVDRVSAIRELLVEAEAAHGVYEATALNGVYDAQWPTWYAAYAVDHGIGAVLGRDVTPNDLAAFLDRSYLEFQQQDPKPIEPWAEYSARRIIEEL